MSTSDEITQVSHVVCATGCGNEAKWLIWNQTWVCTPCLADYEPRVPTYEQIAEKYGPEANATQVLKDFTARWLSARKAKVAA